MMDVEPELEVLSVNDVQLSNKKLRVKLLENLYHSPPPAPLHWTTFREFVERKFKLFYPEKIIRDVFCLVDRTLAKSNGVCTYINLDSDSESEEYTIYSSPKAMSMNNGIPSSESPANESCITNGGEFRRKNRFHKKLNNNTVSTANQLVAMKKCQNDASELSPLESTVSRIPPEKMELLKNDATVKKHGRLVKEIYDLLHEIRDTTSCTLCTKLRNRIDKFRKYVGEECELLKTIDGEDSAESRNGAGNDATNNVGNGHHKYSKRRSSSLDNTCPSDSNQRVILSKKQAEMIRRDILTKKIVEYCLPEILKNNERMNLTQPASLAPKEAQTGGNDTLSVKKRRSRSSQDKSFEQRVSGCGEEDCDKTEPEPVTKQKKKTKKKSKRDSLSEPTSDTSDVSGNPAVRSTRATSKRPSTSKKRELASTPKKKKIELSVS